MKIVILGLAKSGTTGLFYKIKNSLPPGIVCLFEPRSFDPRAIKKKGLRSLLNFGREPDVLAKILPFRPDDASDAESFSDFDKQILIVRDPRDRLVSRLLYGVYDSQFCAYDDKVREFVELLEEKEGDPSHVSLKTLLSTIARLDGKSFSLEKWATEYMRHSILKPLDFHDAHRDIFVFKYEEMIDRRYESLEKYLDLALKGGSTVHPSLGRVVRTKSYGGWRDWFTSEDVEYLRPVMKPFLDRYYPDSNWELNRTPLLPAEYGSGYIKRIVNDRRTLLKLPIVVWRDEHEV